MKLEAGMIVETRNKKRGILLKETIYWQNGGFISVSDYDQNLKTISKLFPETNNIMKIYNLKKIYDIRHMFLDKSLKLIWERKEFDITNPNEIEILKALSKLGLNFIAKDQNGEVYAYQEEPGFDIDNGFWFHQSNHNNYSNVIKIEKGFEWIEYEGLLNVKETLDDNL